ncbi:DUF4339 domain-containing protein [Niastella caeni]|uniref:DUF4339 domain-containing protein n=1 Tax=Niastella caeni TaxID=2569763 RepID=A0A4S8HSQ5_9BACT|nr:DUF4339 domain-containing protein [Niastella caeni]THU38031.1 DUF4339 domain-containing protein [Niastella caeni]
MNTYLLLRDNKQTGPYTAEELAAKGLKPYDLVWHEGRSAAWRYPSEIEELKPFAPVVEEQPYDRFYKKPGLETSSVTEQAATQQKQVAVAGNTMSDVQESQPVSRQAEQANSKHIYVTMPVSKAQAATTTPVAKKEETKPVAQQSDKNVSSTNKNTEKKAVSSYIISEEDDEQNSGMLKGYQNRKKEDDEINNGFLSEYESRKAAFSKNKSGVSTAAVQKAEKPATSKAATWSSTSKKDRFDFKALLAGSGKYLQDNKNVTRGLVAAVLILGGVVIGLVINSGNRQPDTQVLESLVKEIRDQKNEKSGTTGPAGETVQQNNEPMAEERNINEVPNNNSNNNTIEPAPPAGTAPANSVQTNQAVMRQGIIKKDNNVVPPPNQNKSIALPASNTTTQPVEATPAVMETKEKPINQEVLEKARKNIYEQVRIEASAFKVGILGGISDLDITLLNSSLYTLDQVSVEIKYFGPEKKLVKTQTLIFNNVPPGKRRTLEAPRTSRGISIDYTITSINSKSLGMAQAGF